MGRGPVAARARKRGRRRESLRRREVCRGWVEGSRWVTGAVRKGERGRCAKVLTILVGLEEEGSREKVLFCLFV